MCHIHTWRHSCHGKGVQDSVENNQRQITKYCSNCLLLTAAAIWFYEVLVLEQRLTKGEITNTIFFLYLSTKANTIGKATNTTDFPKPVGKLTHTSLFISTICWIASSCCLLSFSKLKMSHTLVNAWSSELSLSSAILFLSRTLRSPR